MVIALILRVVEQFIRETLKNVDDYPAHGNLIKLIIYIYTVGLMFVFTVFN